VSDSALIAAAEAGDDAGFEALHRRHVLAAWGLAQAVTRDDVTALAAVRKAMPAVFAAISRGSYPAALSVRSAVLTATRAAAVSLLHGSTWTGRHHGRDIVDRAFSGLPECWRSALWLAEVERLAAIDAARPLRLPPGEAAALATRARSCFKERYVRIAGAGREPECQAALRLMPRDSHELAPHEVAQLDQHLAACRACRTSSVELTSLGPTLRAVALPTPLLAMAAPDARNHREPGRDSRRFVPALAAVVAVIFGLSSVAAIQGDAAKPAEQVASPIDAAAPVRDPVTIRTFAAPRSAVTAPVGAASVAAPVPSAAPAVDRQVVAAAGPAPPVPVDLDTPSDAARTAESPSEPAAEDADPSDPAPAADAPSDSAPGGGQQPPPPESTEDAQVGVEAAGVEASVTVDLESPTPVVVEIATPAPDTGLHTALSGSGA